MNNWESVCHLLASFTKYNRKEVPSIIYNLVNNERDKKPK